MDGEESGDQLTTVYKCIFLSYVVYAGEIGGEYGHFGCFIIAMFLPLFFQKCLEKGIETLSSSKERNKKRIKSGKNSNNSQLSFI